MAPDRPVAEANESPPRLRIPSPTLKLEEELLDGRCSPGDTRPDDQHDFHAKFEPFDEPDLPDTEEIVIEEEVPLKSEQPDDKGSSQSDDDLTSLSWLHQQNLLKGLELTEHHGIVKTVKVENILNNNIECEDSLDNSESTHSISSIESFSPAESIGKSLSMQNLSCDEAFTTNEVAIDNRKSDKIIVNNNNNNNNNVNSNKNNSNSGAGIGVSSYSLAPAPSRSKHPTHIPYDPHLHKNSKPPYSFSCLIFMAIEDSPLKALPVKEVYAWILEHFPYFRNAPTGWKNSVRHNLSLNKCFRKVEKSPNLGKGSLWMVDAQYRPNLIQALSRSPFPPPTATNFGTTPDKIARKVPNSRLPDPVLFPYLSKRLASSNIDDGPDAEFDSDVDAAAAAMLSFKHGPVILNHNQERKNKQTADKMVPVITRSSTEDHTYSLITSVRLERRMENDDQILADVDEQRKIAEGADALLNLAGVHTTIARDPLALRAFDPDELDRGTNRQIFVTYKNSTSYVPGSDPLEIQPSLAKRRSSGNEGPNKRRKRPWRDTWADTGRYMKQVRG